MNINMDKNPEITMLLDLNRTIHSSSKNRFEYHMKHIQLVQKYALLLNQRLHANLNNRKLSYISLAHDLFKEHGLDPERNLIWRGHIIPQDNIRYVRTNLDLLEEYDLDEYFNTDIQYHALAAGIFLIKEFGINDPEILYPIFFHSCPIISVYKSLNPKTQLMVDIITLADKLSSNWLRINFKKVPVRIDLDLTIFGSSGKEFNYTLGLFLARLISQGKSTEKQSIISTDYYFQRLHNINPIISKEYTIKMLGGNKLWQPRKSQAFLMQ